jgi:hypothetical protein
MAPPTQKVAGVIGYQANGWMRTPGNSLEERFVVAVMFEGGYHRMYHETMTYEKGEREAIMERAVTARATRADRRRLREIREQRERKAQSVYGQLQSLYGNGLTLE